jgi:hypothetical protein
VLDALSCDAGDKQFKGVGVNLLARLPGIGLISLVKIVVLPVAPSSWPDGGACRKSASLALGSAFGADSLGTDAYPQHFEQLASTGAYLLVGSPPGWS